MHLALCKVDTMLNVDRSRWRRNISSAQPQAPRDPEPAANKSGTYNRTNANLYHSSAPS